MKNQKLHTFPLETPFLKKIETGVQYFNQNHYTNFSDNSIEIRTFDESQLVYLPIDPIFEKILNTLSLHNIKYLTKLNISIQASFTFKISTVRKFGLNLASQFKTLKHLDLRFLSCEDLNGERMRCLLDSLTKGMKHLTEINLSFLGCTDIGDQCLEDLKLFILKRCKSLKRFKVIIAGEMLDKRGEGLVYFEPDVDQKLQNPNNLFEYSFWSEQNQITSSGSASFCRGVARYLKRLRSLTFKIDSPQKERTILRMISNLSNLQSLNFSSSETMNDEKLTKLTSCIKKNLKHLQSLTLNFPDKGRITDGCYQRFAQDFISSLPSQLSYFALNFEYSPLETSATDANIREIGLNIAKSLRSLQTLILRFCFMQKLTGKALLELTQTIGKGLPSLKKLILGFDECEGIDQNFSLMLPEQIQQFDLYFFKPSFSVHETWKGLNRLSLSVNACRNQNKSPMEIFSDSSFTWKNLNDLKLIISQRPKIESQQMKNLASAIGTNLENLRTLELGFSDCSFLTADSLLFFGDKMCKKLKNLRHLNLSFFGSDDVENSSFIEDGVRSLSSIITSNLEGLESLKLLFCVSKDAEEIINMENMEEIVDELCTAISRNLKRLKKLTLTFNLSWRPELKRKIRERLCHIPMIYLSAKE